MRILGFLVALFTMALTMPASAGPGVLALKPDQLREMELDSIPPWPEGVVVSGTNEHWQKVLYEGEYVVTIYEAMPVKFREMIVVETKAWVASGE